MKQFGVYIFLALSFPMVIMLVSSQFSSHWETFSNLISELINYLGFGSHDPPQVNAPPLPDEVGILKLENVTLQNKIERLTELLKNDAIAAKLANSENLAQEQLVSDIEAVCDAIAKENKTVGNFLLEFTALFTTLAKKNATAHDSSNPSEVRKKIADEHTLSMLKHVLKARELGKGGRKDMKDYFNEKGLTTSTGGKYYERAVLLLIDKLEAKGLLEPEERKRTGRPRKVEEHNIA